MKFDLVVKNGTVVQPGHTHTADVGIQNGIIADIGQKLDGIRNIDASNLLVLPGGIDPHVHLEMNAGLATSSDDWFSGTRAAAIGGTTTLIDFIEPNPGETLLEAFTTRNQQAQKGAVIDYSLHMTITDSKAETLCQIPGVIASGIPSFKTYTTYAFRLNDEELIAVMDVVGKNGGLLLTHAENDAIVQFMRNKLLRQGSIEPRFHPVSRPAIAESEAVHRMIALVQTANAPLYIVHVSTSAGAAAIKKARENGQTVFGETCPQYLTLTETEYSRSGFEGAKFVCSPPLRTSDDNEYLLSALGEGTLQTVGTDHCPFFFKGQKEIGRDDFTKIPGGIPGIEARLMLTYTYGVKANRFDLNRWVDMISTNPARIFGLYPQKGTLQPGSDADLVLFDPNREGVITKTMLHENVDYTPYEGLKYTGYPTMTISRGKVIAKDGEFIGIRGAGNFIPRKIKKEIIR